MKTSLIRIGNSRGVRLPKVVIEACRLDGEIEMIVEANQVILKPAAKDLQAGWDDPERWKGADEPLSDEDRAWLDFPNDDSDLD